MGLQEFSPSSTRLLVVGDLKNVLGSLPHYDLFIIGHGAAEEARQEMVLWIKAKFPRVKILAINPPNQKVPRADYNVRQNGPENWLPIVSRELAKSGDSSGPTAASTSGA